MDLQPSYPLVRNDATTTKVYFAPFLSRYKCWPELSGALERLQINHDFLPPGALDIWVRDFMPIPLSEGRFLGYEYTPDYLRDLPQFRTNGAIFARKILQKEEIIETKILLDGGNIIVCGDKVIMTEKIFQENPKFSHKRLIASLENAFNAELVIIPWDRREYLGHADGVVRYISGNDVLLNHFEQSDADYRNNTIKALQAHGLHVEELHYNIAHPHKWNWAYLNYLRVGQKIIVPRLDAAEDEQAMRQLSAILQAEVATVNVNTIIRRGGALNCISWTI